MTPTEALAAIHEAKPVECTAEEYPAIRRAIQDKAAKYLDWGDNLRAMIALEEVKRQDRIHDVGLSIIETLQ